MRDSRSEGAELRRDVCCPRSGALDLLLTTLGCSLEVSGLETRSSSSECMSGAGERGQEFAAYDAALLLESRYMLRIRVFTQNLRSRFLLRDHGSV